MSRDEYSSGMSKEALALYDEALELGWAPRRVSSNNHLLMDHPSGVTASLPQNPGAANRAFQNTAATIRRVNKVTGTATESELIAMTAAVRQGNIVKEFPPDLIRKRDAAISKRTSGGRIHQSLRVPEIIELGPWLAKSQMTAFGGLLYASGAVLEAKWNDGSTEYLCADPDCDYANALPRSVSGHYAAKHGASNPTFEAARKKAFLAPDVSWEPTQRQISTIRKLTTEIEEALRTGAVTPEEIARAIVVARGDRDETDAGEPRDLTPEQIIMRIKRLLGVHDQADIDRAIAQVSDDLRLEFQASIDQTVGSMVEPLEEQVATLVGESEALRAANQSALEAQRAAEAQAMKWKDKWKALQAIVSEDKDE